MSYETASGEVGAADVFNVAVGGIFVETEEQYPVGTRLDLEITVAGEPTTISATARVVWRRDFVRAGTPMGMALKFIDVDDEAHQTLTRLVMRREQTLTGLGAIIPPLDPAEMRPLAPSLPFALVKRRRIAVQRAKSTLGAALLLAGVVLGLALAADHAGLTETHTLFTWEP